jgi:hypothetical protein
MLPNQDVLDSLKEQTYKHVDIVPVIAGENLQPIKTDWSRKMNNICLARNACLTRMVDQDFAAMLDADCLLLPEYPDSLQLMLDTLMQDRELVAVALRKNDANQADHISMGCVMFKFAFHRLGISFRFDIGNCECKCLTKDIRAAGYKFEYADNKVRINNLSKHQFKEAA